MSRRFRLVLGLFALVLLLPSSGYAQAAIAGVVRDASGGVLPGVTVEASSPALIEKVRTAVSDGTGQYRIEDLRPGAYTVRFTLGGFSTVSREGVELTGSATATISIDMRVGAVEETITVTGETPVVDTQGARRQTVLTNEVINAIPSAGSYNSLLVLVPGVFGGQQDVASGPCNSPPRRPTSRTLPPTSWSSRAPSRSRTAGTRGPVLVVPRRLGIGGLGRELVGRRAGRGGRAFDLGPAKRPSGPRPPIRATPSISQPLSRQARSLAAFQACARFRT